MVMEKDGHSKPRHGNAVGVGGRSSPTQIGKAGKAMQEPGDASKNYCSHMEWKGGKEHSGHSGKYSK